MANMSNTMTASVKMTREHAGIDVFPLAARATAVARRRRSSSCCLPTTFSDTVEHLQR